MTVFANKSLVFIAGCIAIQRLSTTEQVLSRENARERKAPPAIDANGAYSESGAVYFAGAELASVAPSASSAE